MLAVVFGCQLPFDLFTFALRRWAGGVFAPRAKAIVNRLLRKPFLQLRLRNPSGRDQINKLPSLQKLGSLRPKSMEEG